MKATAIIEVPWRDPLTALDALADRPWTLGFLSGGEEARWSYVMADPVDTLVLAADDRRDPFQALEALVGPAVAGDPAGPPFQGGVAGLASYEFGDRIEPLGLDRHDGWPDLACAVYPAVLAFDHVRGRLLAVGRGADGPDAQANARRALSWLTAAAPPPRAAAGTLAPDDPQVYRAAVAEVVSRIRGGEIFQANIARRWRGRLEPGVRPFDLMTGLAARSPAPFAAYLRLPGRAVVSNSPERLVSVVAEAHGRLDARTQPIKGTAPRHAAPDQDRALAHALAASAKDRAENLMIVDLMRNDLSRVCAPGSVRTPELFRVATYANVHHLVSTVVGRLASGRTALDLLRAAFPAGSITGAPKVQAMKVIAGLEAPRGPFFGAMFQLGFDGGFDSSVLIRTVAFVEDADGWRMEARAGAGIVADSDPAAEARETETKIAAILGTLATPPARPAPGVDPTPGTPPAAHPIR